MPAEDVSDLKDVFDAIDRLCETMKTSSYDEESYEEPVVETYDSPRYVECGVELVSPEEVFVQTIETYRAERWSDPQPQDESDAVTSDTEPALAQCEPVSEMYYTASSEVSLLSDLDIPERPNDNESPPDEETDDRKECVIAGHVAAMRERFESMTRTNTPCPDSMRSTSPSLDVFRNMTPSPDNVLE